MDRGVWPSAPSQAQADTLTYEPYFGLNEKPFSLNADPRFLYDSPTYTATRASLVSGIRRREGLLVLTGQIGSGKTTLCRGVLADLGRNTYGSLVPDPFASREDLLKMLLIDFGVLSIEALTTGPLRQASRTELGYLLSEFLDALPSDAHVIVMIDEAQHLSLPLIEETRLLSDTFAAKGRLQMVFVGQPELHARLKLPEMRQVDQRICGYHRLLPMSREAVAGYVHHRLKVAGGQAERELFPADVITTLHLRSGGVPRLINRVCDRALHLACERRAERVELEVLEAALIEIGAVTMSPTWDSILFEEPPVPAAPAASAAARVAEPAAEVAPGLSRGATSEIAPAAAPVETTPALDDDDSFEKQVKDWASQDLAPATRTLTRGQMTLPDEAPARPAKRTPAPQSTSRRVLPPRPFTTDWPRDMRSEPYMQKLLRMWAKWLALSLAALVAVYLVIAGASFVISLATASSDLPLLPDAPARDIAALELPAPMSIDTTPSVSDAPATSAAVPVAVPAEPANAAPAAEYLIAVGMFADRDRADRLVDVLTQAGFPAMQRPIQLRQTLVQQIALGPFFSRADADAELRRLRLRGGYDDARVIDESAAK